MTRGICTFRQRDVTAAVKAVVAAGVAVARVEVDKSGKIVIIVGKGGELGKSNVDGSNAANEWDEVFDGTGEASIRQ
jgi:PHP family Zn ribbon phosphoesterase